VIVVSHSTKKDVEALLGVPSERIAVVHNGVGEEFRPAPVADVESFRRRQQLPDRYVLYLGTLEPRKNVPQLIEAFACWRQRGNSSEVKLVLAGARGWYDEEIFALVERVGLTEDVLFPGYVPTAELPWWYRAADLFVYPSRYEGFGLPLLEAMACGTPVIASDASSLPEVVGDAGLLVDPDDVIALAEAIDQVMSNVEFSASLSQAGIQQARTFSWQCAAAQTAAVHRQVLAETQGQSRRRVEADVQAVKELER